MVERTDDAALLAAAKDGDLDAFEALVRAHSGTVYAHALRFFGDRAAAEDVAQEVWIKVYRSLATFDQRARFSTWLFRVTRNTCLDTVRAASTARSRSRWSTSSQHPAIWPTKSR